MADEKAETMRRSQLEMHLDILEVLDHRGPLKLTHVMHKANVNCRVLKEYLDFLTKQGLVEMRIIGKERKVYAITQLGVTVLKQFRELKEVLPIVEETENEARNQELLCSKEQIL
jgi:predicted transcriptional regulator